MIFRHGEVIPNLACILGELNCFSGFWLLFFSNLMIFSIKLGSQIFQNNALVKVPYVLKLFSTQEHGKNCYYYYCYCRKSGYWNDKIRSIWYWDELIEHYEVFFQQRIKNQGFYRQSKKLWYVPWFLKQKAAIRLQKIGLKATAAKRPHFAHGCDTECVINYIHTFWLLNQHCLCQHLQVYLG